MRVTVKLYGNLKKYLPGKKEVGQMEVEAGTTIAALLARFGVPDSEVWMSAVNDTVVDASTPLRDGDVLEVFEPVGGGLTPRPGDTETRRQGDTGTRGQGVRSTQHVTRNTQHATRNT